MSDDDKRKHTRLILPNDNYAVYVTNSENNTFPVKVKDISKGGIGIIADSYDCYDEEFLIQINKITPGGEEEEFNARGTVRWIQEEKDGGIAFGIQFDFLDEEMEQKLLDIIGSSNHSS